MPRITSQWSVKPTSGGWQKTTVSKYSTFPSMKPQFRTSDAFSEMWGRLPYRNHLNHAQIYTDLSRKEYLCQLKTCLQQLPCDRTLQIRWRFDKEVPSFSLDFLFLYMSRFGKVEAIYQQATNACLVLFKNHRSAWLAANKRDLGLPYGRLFARWWNPPPQDSDQLRVTKHVEKAAETRTRCHSLMDADDRLAASSVLRACARVITESNRDGGPTLMAYLTEGVRRPVSSCIEKVKRTLPRKRTGEVVAISSVEQFHKVIKRGRLTVVDFYATWCGPCKAIAPVIESWAAEFRDVVFVKVDVDEHPEIAQEYMISAMPTFVLIKNSVTLDVIVGAFEEKLRETILVLK
ncbi:unnamed protein product [Candidula unifasciata]|uniref:Thioredoxin domain-containing protein n=1 Tax=Candidula unifasciata TaxID=100452 RepID=A0A8S3ZT11_9EUPU|nr:unnamed protein product [Candidula unifasciata]